MTTTLRWTGKWVVTLRGCDSRTGKFARHEVYNTKEDAEYNARLGVRFGLQTHVTAQMELVTEARA